MTKDPHSPRALWLRVFLTTGPSFAVLWSGGMALSLDRPFLDILLPGGLLAGLLFGVLFGLWLVRMLKPTRVHLPTTVPVQELKALLVEQARTCGYRLASESPQSLTFRHVRKVAGTRPELLVKSSESGGIELQGPQGDVRRIQRGLGKA
jgi:hypothetical protein